MSLEHLFEPTKVGDLEIKNRVVMLSMGTLYIEDEFITDRYVRFLAERAKGGVGLIFTPFRPCETDPKLRLAGIYDDKFIPSLCKLTDSVHEYGAKIGAQLTISYQWERSGSKAVEFVGPSEVVTTPRLGRPRALTVEEIHFITGQYAEAAVRARECGFDAVDIMTGAGYLFDRFLSPLTNKRTDEYGGSLQNRMRFLLEVINAVKAAAGKDFPVMCRFTIDDFMKGGRPLSESKQVAASLEDAGVAGLISYFGWHECPRPTVAGTIPAGAFAHLTEEIKREVNIPIVASNRIQSPVVAEKILSGDQADLIGMGRALIADPELPNKSKEGKLEEIRPCLCCSNCLEMGFRGEPIACTVNPFAGKEGDLKILSASQPRRIFVIGGGPTGIEAAVTATARGHDVTLWEKSRELGGQLKPGSKPPYKQRITKYKNYLVHKLERSGVRVVLDEMPAISSVQDKPDAVIVATGAVPIVPEIPGVDGANVLTAVDLLLNDRWDDAESFVIIGGGSVGCETADLLAAKKKTVTVLEMTDRIGMDIGMTNRWIILKRLRDVGVKMVVGAKAVEITKQGVKVEKEGAIEFFEGERAVLAVGMRSSGEGADLSGVEVRLAGDRVKPGKIFQAVREGLRVGIEV